MRSILHSFININSQTYLNHTEMNELLHNTNHDSNLCTKCNKIILYKVINISWDNSKHIENVL